MDLKNCLKDCCNIFYQNVLKSIFEEMIFPNVDCAFLVRISSDCWMTKIGFVYQTNLFKLFRVRRSMWPDCKWNNWQIKSHEIPLESQLIAIIHALSNMSKYLSTYTVCLSIVKLCTEVNIAFNYIGMLTLVEKNAKSIFIYVMKYVPGFIWNLGINFTVFIKWIDKTWWNNRLLLVPSCYEVVAMVATMVAMVAPLWCHTLG